MTLASMESLSDEELVGRYRADPAGGASCVNELFRRHYSRVGAWCYRLMEDRDSAADVAQEVFVKAYQALESFRGSAKFSSWLYAIARNHCFNALKARSARPEETGDEAVENAADPTPDPLSDLERADSVQLVRRLMRESLDEVELEVMVLHYVEELPLDAITRLLDLGNASGAKAYVVSARRKLSAAGRRWLASTTLKGSRGA